MLEILTPEDPHRQTIGGMFRFRSFFIEQAPKKERNQLAQEHRGVLMAVRLRFVLLIQSFIVLDFLTGRKLKECHTHRPSLPGGKRVLT